jgi:hypothetical protein
MGSHMSGKVNFHFQTIYCGNTHMTARDVLLSVFYLFIFIFYPPPNATTCSPELLDLPSGGGVV